jgi:hypothetical protein
VPSPGGLTPPPFSGRPTPVPDSVRRLTDPPPAARVPWQTPSPLPPVSRRELARPSGQPGMPPNVQGAKGYVPLPPRNHFPPQTVLKGSGSSIPPPLSKAPVTRVPLPPSGTPARPQEGTAPATRRPPRRRQ